MIQALLLSLLHLLSLIALIRLSLPKLYVVLNPYCAGVDILFSRLLKTVHAAIPVGTKPLCGMVILLALAARSALLFRAGTADLQLGVFFTAHFTPASFPGWFAFALLDFLAFWFTLQASVLILQLWHFLRPLPGFAGDLLQQATYPVSALPLRFRIPAVLLLATLLTAVPLTCASSVEFVPVPLLTDLIQDHLLAGRAAPQAPLSAAQIAVVLFSFVPLIVSSIQSFLVLALVFRLFSGFLKSKPVYFLTGELLTIFCGRLPRVGIGLFDLTPILAFFVFNVIVNSLAILCGVLLYVV